MLVLVGRLLSRRLLLAHPRSRDAGLLRRRCSQVASRPDWKLRSPPSGTGNRRSYFESTGPGRTRRPGSGARTGLVLGQILESHSSGETSEGQSLSEAEAHTHTGAPVVTTVLLWAVGLF